MQSGGSPHAKYRPKTASKPSANAAESLSERRIEGFFTPTAFSANATEGQKDEEFCGFRARRHSAPGPLFFDRVKKKPSVTAQVSESEYSIGPDVPILANAPGDISLLKPGAAVFVIALKKPDGTITSARLYAEKDGVKPPM